MLGMSATTGAPLDGDAHLLQSIRDILLTPIGSRVMRREYGSDLPALVDAPMNPTGKLRLFAAVAAALGRWEPRLKLTRVALDAGSADGAFDLVVEGERIADSTAARFVIPLTA